jgi:hypothetical protein
LHVKVKIRRLTETERFKVGTNDDSHGDYEDMKISVLFNLKHLKRHFIVQLFQFSQNSAEQGCENIKLHTSLEAEDSHHLSIC